MPQVIKFWIMIKVSMSSLSISLSVLSVPVSLRRMTRSHKKKYSEYCTHSLASCLCASKSFCWFYTLLAFPMCCGHAVIQIKQFQQPFFCSSSFSPYIRSIRLPLPHIQAEPHEELNFIHTIFRFVPLSIHCSCV